MDDSNLSEHDPYNELVEEAKRDRTPEFLNSIKGKDSKKRSSSSSDKAGKTGAQASLGKAESSAASGGFYKNGMSAKSIEESPSNRFSFRGINKQAGGKKKGKFGGFKASAGIVIMLVLIVMVAAIALSTPLFHIGNIDFNLMDALGFLDTVGILEWQAEYVIGDEMAHGKVPDELAGKLASHGLTVGQVASNGDFVRTNVYVANADDLKDLAVLGNFQVQPSEGELAMLYKDKVITASEFAEAVESDPVMYAEYSNAIDIGPLYYYGKDANEVLKNAGVSRSLFYGWEDTGDEQTNEEQFKKIIEEGINKVSELAVSGFDEASAGTETGVTNTSDVVLAVRTDRVQDQNENEEEKAPSVTNEDKEKLEQEYGTDSDSDTDTSASTLPSISGVSLSGDNASDIVNKVADDVRDSSQGAATSKAAQLLNSAISASEPYLAASAFMAVEEPIQRVRIEGDGPIHQVMTLLNKETSVEYVDMQTGETVESNKAILTTTNFVAAVSSGKYSSSEAANFSRDRALLATGLGSGGNIKKTVVGTEGRKESNVVIGAGSAVGADKNKLRIIDNAIDMSMVQKNSDLLPSVVGGNRIVEGGAFLSNMINARGVGAMGADDAEIAKYHQEVKEVLARKAEAERATKSPFDASSPYTFLGSLLRKVGNAMIQSRASTGGSVVGTIAGLAGESVKGLVGDVIADGDDDSYAMTHGKNCDTVNSASSVEGDIYCTAQTVISTGYIKKGSDYWKKQIDDDEYEDFVKLAMDRQATIGVKSAQVCEAWRSEHGTPILSAISDLFGAYEACSPNFVENWVGDYSELESIATGSHYTMSSSNSNKKKTAKLAGYALYDQVSSLLESDTSRASQILDEYYAEHPKDNSRAGIIARRSGMSKGEAEIALAYADYLIYIARYDPSTRYSFGWEYMLEVPREPLVDHANEVASELYALWHGRTEYDDLRGRIRVG